MIIIDTHNRNPNSKARFGGKITPSAQGYGTHHQRKFHMSERNVFVLEKTTFTIKDCVVYRHLIFSRRQQMQNRVLTIKKKAVSLFSLERGMFGHFSSMGSVIFIAAQTGV